MSNSARLGVIGLMVLAICVARLVEVELAAPKLQVEVVRPADDEVTPALETQTPQASPAELQVAVAPTPAAPKPQGETYTVKKGDTLGKISKAVYGTTRYWKLIHDANKDVIPNPKRMKLGASLRIPPRPVSESK